MTKLNKVNQAVRDQIVEVITKQGFKCDAYGNYKNSTGDRRIKFSATSFRYEQKIDTKPVSWIRIMGGYYKHTSINDGKVVISR